MTAGMFGGLEDALFGFSGSMWLVAIIILIVFIVAFLIVGVDFRYALIFSSPLVLGFTEIGWFPIWIQTVFWLLIIGIGAYLLYTYMSDR